MINSLFSLLFLAYLFSANNSLKKALDKIPKSQDCKIEFIKKTDSEILQTSNSVPAVLYITKGKFYFETQSENKNVIIYDSKWYWILEYEGEKLNQVSRTKNKQANFNDILDSKLLNINFKVTEIKKDSGVYVDLIPKKNNFAFDKAQLIIKENSLYQIQYEDDIQNKTTLLIKTINCTTKINSRRYKFLPPKGQPILDL